MPSKSKTPRKLVEIGDFFTGKACDVTSTSTPNQYIVTFQKATAGERFKEQPLSYKFKTLVILPSTVIGGPITPRNIIQGEIKALSLERFNSNDADTLMLSPDLRLTASNGRTVYIDVLNIK